MKKIITRKSAIINIIAGFVILMIYTLWVYIAIKKRIGIRLENDTYEDAAFCVPDMLETSFKVTRLLLMTIFVIILISILKSYFRNMIMLQYTSRTAILWKNYKYCVCIAFILSLGATVISTILGSVLSDSYSNNWYKKGSFMYLYCGIPNKPHILPTWESILIYAATLFFTLVIVGLVIIFFWYLFNPVAGLIVVFVMYALEVTQTPPVFQILFSYLNIVNTRIYFNGMNFKHFFLCPLIWCIVLITANILLIRKKNLFY